MRAGRSSPWLCPWPQPVPTSALSPCCCYSERSLRNAFHERFGCGPVHWIRSQRLAAARQRLLRTAPVAVPPGFPARRWPAAIRGDARESLELSRGAEAVPCCTQSRVCNGSR
ncbi:MAG: helix-turn-helix domain-containing protein [Vulcanococcus sp.]